MEQRETVSKERSRLDERFKEPKMHLVYILNDDFTTFEFVVFLMMEVFLKSEEDAWGIAEATHTRGKSLVGRYTCDMAHTKVNKATAMARENGFPLSFKIIPEDQHAK